MSDKDFDMAIDLIAELMKICYPPEEQWPNIFRRKNMSRVADYMGSGYPFIDAFNRIWDEFLYETSDELYHAIMKKVDPERYDNDKSRSSN